MVSSTLSQTDIKKAAKILAYLFENFGVTSNKNIKKVKQSSIHHKSSKQQIQKKSYYNLGHQHMGHMGQYHYNMGYNHMGHYQQYYPGHCYMGYHHMGHNHVGNFHRTHKHMGNYHMGHQETNRWANMGYHPIYVRSNLNYQRSNRGNRGNRTKLNFDNRLEKERPVYELNALSISDLEQIEKEVGFLKLSDFSYLREKYETRSLMLTSLKHQLSSYTERYKNEVKKEKDKQDIEVLQQYRLLETEVKTLTTQLDEIEKKIKKMMDTPSPFAIQNIKMPKVGTEDTYNHKKLDCVPYSDEKTSVREVWNFLVEIGEDLKLSETGFKRAMWSRLTTEQRESFDSYKEKPLKEAINSLISHFDNPLKSYHYHDLINNFTRKETENITNSIYRLLSYVDKAFRNQSMEKEEDKDLQVLRIRTLEDKLRGMCRTKEMYTSITKKLDKYPCHIHITILPRQA